MSDECTLSVFIENGAVVLEFNTVKGEDIRLPFPPGEAGNVGQALLDAERIIGRQPDE